MKIKLTLLTIISPATRGHVGVAENLNKREARKTPMHCLSCYPPPRPRGCPFVQGEQEVRT